MQGSKRFSKWAVRLGGAVCLIAVPSVVLANLDWTDWISEETPGQAFCQGFDEGTVGFGCRGRFCDDVRLLCETAPFGITFDLHDWSNFFSEETDGIGTTIPGAWFNPDAKNRQICGWPGSRPGVVTGIACKGRFCDNIALECAFPVKVINGRTVNVGVRDCVWSGWHSEEQGSVDFTANRYITGVDCRGSFCDDKRFLVCSLVNPG